MCPELNEGPEGEEGEKKGLSSAQFAELWTHKRPVTGGFHQLHFDSENEGIGGVKNPVATMVLFLPHASEVPDVAAGEEAALAEETSAEKKRDVAPTLVTNQVYGSVEETTGSARGTLAYQSGRPRDAG